MNKIKILHCADIHIGAAESFLGAFAAKRRIETLITFEKIIDTAAANGVRIVAIVGDLFNSNDVESSLYEPVFKKIADVPDIKVIFAAGNHDPLNPSSPFFGRKLPNNLYVLGTKDSCIDFEDIGVRVYGRSFQSVYMCGEKRFTLLPPDDEKINLMVLHGELKGDLSSEYNPITSEFIENSGMDYIALGHIHKRSEIMKLANTYYAYSGCAEGQGFDECDEKGVYIGNIGKGICELEFLPISKRRHIRESIDITGADTPYNVSELIISTLEKKYGEDFSKNLYRIELIGKAFDETVNNLSEITARLSDRLYFVKLKDKTEPNYNLEELSNEISLKGLFVKNMLRKIGESEGEEKETLKYALNIGIKAFNSEVAFDED